MQLVAQDRVLNLKVLRVMGILNVTPDSFSDGGKYQQLANAIDYTAAMLDAGATLIDIGGESTRPGAKAVNDAEEAERVVPVVTALTHRFDTFISVDTSKALVIRESAAAGAHLINDICSLNAPEALVAAADSQLPIRLMYMQRNLSTLQQERRHKNTVEEVHDFFFVRQIKRYEAAGITKNRLVLDPGFGFDKTLEHNYRLLARLSDFHYFGLPILVGMSRKSMIGKLLGLPVNQRVSGSIFCAIIAALQGVQIIRAHDVRQTVEVLSVAAATLTEKVTYFK